MTTGSIVLRSGSWDWRVHALPRGALVVYRHRSRFDDEMRTWIDCPEMMPMNAKESALDPVSRTWDDGFGRRWRVSMSGPPTTPEILATEPLWLVFESGYRVRSVVVPGETRLGALSHTELTQLLAAAE